MKGSENKYTCISLLDARVMCNRISPIVEFFSFFHSFLVAAAVFYFELNLSLQCQV